jgi:hypothetical protein
MEPAPVGTWNAAALAGAGHGAAASAAAAAPQPRPAATLTSPFHPVAPPADPASDHARQEFPRALDGRFEVVRVLGRGGMGAVFLARDRQLGREVAVKLLLGRAEQNVALLAKEAQVLAGLEHDNVVRLYEYGQSAGTPYLVMEYVRGRSLAVRLAAGRPTVVEAVRTGVEILAGVEAAHRKGIAHLDLKPANVFLDPAGRAKVADFGLARPVRAGGGPESAPGGVTSGGTPGYMAPEQWSGEAGLPADVYAAGVIFYELLTGRRLFSAATLEGYRDLQSARDAPAPSSVNPSVPRVLDQVVARCLALSPERRPSVPEVAAALAEWLGRVTRSSRQPGAAGFPSHPYKLLKAFGVEDEPIFFGRDAETAELRALVESPEVRLVHVFGPCGIGKSSLLRAGLVRALDPVRTEVMVLLAGPDPARALREAIAARACALGLLLPGRRPVAASVLGDEPRLLADLIPQLVAALGRALVLVVDQCEEVFTQNARGAGAATALFEVVGQLVELQAVAVTIVLSFRTDFRGDFFPLEQRLGRHLVSFAVGEIEERGMVEAMEGPSHIEAYAFDYEDGLCDRLAAEILGSARQRGDAALPVMQIICRQLYDRARAKGVHTIDQELYEGAIGDVEGALRRYVEDRLESPEYAQSQALARQMIKALTTREDGGERFARPMDEEDLLAFPDRERARLTLEQLVADHLVVREAGEGERRRIRLASEVICPLVDVWALEPDEAERAGRVLMRAYRQWKEEGSGAKDLLTTGTLALVQRQFSAIQTISEGEARYLDQSVRYHRRRRATLMLSVLLPLIAIFAVLYVLVSRSVSNEVLDNERRLLESTQRVVQEFLERHYERLLGESTVIAESPKLVAAVETGDPATIADEAAHFRRIIDSGLLAVADARKRILGSVARSGRPIKSDTDVPALRRCDGKKATTGVLAKDQTIYLVVSVPMVTQGGLSGFLITGFEVDQRFVDLVKSVAASDVLVALDRVDDVLLVAHLEGTHELRSGSHSELLHVEIVEEPVAR